MSPWPKWARGGMVDTPALGAGPLGGVGSSPTEPTNHNKHDWGEMKSAVEYPKYKNKVYIFE